MGEPLKRSVLRYQLSQERSDYDRQFMTAVVENDIREVLQLIEEGIDLNHRCDAGASALFGAILEGNVSIIKLMLERGADPNLMADEPAAIIYTEKPLDLARQARFLMDWDKYHPIVELLEAFGATNDNGELKRIQRLLSFEQENGNQEQPINRVEFCNQRRAEQALGADSP